MNPADQRINDLRKTFPQLGIAALVVPTQDPHFSEYPPEHHRVRAYLTGFTGSAGTLIVTADTAGLWTDSRYFLEAEAALASTGVDLFRLQTPEVPDWPNWLTLHLDRGDALGIDGRLLSLTEETRLRSTLEPRGIAVRAVRDPAASIWPDRPPVPANPVTIHGDDYAGESADRKIAAVRSAMDKAGAGAHLVSTLDDIAWMTNLRGSDVDFNPLFVAYLLVTPSNATLFADPDHFTPEIDRHLERSGIRRLPYESLEREADGVTGTVLLDPDRTSVAVRKMFGSDVAVIRGQQPSLLAKACKPITEIEHTRTAMQRDGVAMVRFLMWLESRVGESAPVTELEAARKLTALRESGENYVSDAFRPISAVGAHAAMPHYSVTADSSVRIDPPAVYLTDSGAQYLDGTTDITRTLAFGEVPPTFREDFALVLRGMIALATLRFPRGWAGRDLDAVARLAMWREGRNFGHGTGHGVGYFMNVHEGPQRIAPTASDTPLEPGMIVSDEPGIYRTGEYGIRIENLLVVREDESTPFAEFLTFETLTLCPIERSLIEPGLYEHKELAWINAYHERVFTELAPHLQREERTWLEKATKPVIGAE